MKKSFITSGPGYIEAAYIGVVFSTEFFLLLFSILHVIVFSS